MKENITWYIHTLLLLLHIEQTDSNFYKEFPPTFLELESCLHV